MNKRYKVLCLNGSNKGKEVEVEAPYTAEEERIKKDQLKFVVPYTAEEEQLKKDKLKFVVDGIEYAGYCSGCRYPVRTEDARYITNVDGIGNLLVDVHHKYCL